MNKEKLNTLLLHCIGWLVVFRLPDIFIISQATQVDVKKGDGFNQRLHHSAKIKTRQKVAINFIIKGNITGKKSPYWY